ncbi:MAG: universal stress protein [Desulfomonile sp.]|nr:universal stress protein [Desulfomonile sp.]
MPRRILLCTDFSENSQPAGRMASICARAFGSNLLVLHVINSKRIGFSSPEGEVPVDIKRLLDNIRESCDQALQLVADQFREEGHNVTAHCVTGVPSSEIVRFARENAVDLIVMGTHGWTGIKHLIMGSTAENVLRSSACPVLTVRPKQVR